MLRHQVWRAMRWRHVANTDYDGAVLVGGLENELRHFGDPDEEHDYWVHPSPIKPCPYTHEGARAIAAADKKEEQRKLMAARRYCILGISNYENDASHADFDEAAVNEEEKEKEEDGYAVEGDGETLEFHDEWFGGDPPDEFVENEVGFGDCSQCGGLLKGQFFGDIEEVDNYQWNSEDMMADSTKDSDTYTEQEDDDSDLDLGESFISMFNEEFESEDNAEELRNEIASVGSSKSHSLCICDDYAFVEIDSTNVINGLNGTEKVPCPARTVISAQPGLWRSMTACKPLERARRPHIVRPGSWQAV